MRMIKVRTKILSLLLSTILVLGLALVCLVQPILKDNLHTVLEGKGKFMVGHLAMMSVDYLLTEKFLQLQIMLREFPAEDDDTVYIFVQDRNNEVVAHTFEMGFPVDLKEANPLPNDAKISSAHITLGGTSVVDIAVPIMGGGLGHVHIGLSEAYISETTTRIIAVILAAICSVLLLGCIFASLFAKKLTQPLAELVKVTKAVGSGDLKQRVSTISNDELGLVGSSLNQMINDLQQTTVSKDDFQKQTEFLHEVVESIPYPFCVINVSDHTIAMANSATGISASENEITCHSLSHKNDKPCWQAGSCECPLVKVKETGQPAVVEHTHCHQQEQKYYEVHGYPIFDADQNVVQIIELSIEITERKLAEKALQKSQESLKQKNLELEKTYQDLKSTHSQLLQQEKMASIGQLAAGVAHEINNPMGFITSNLLTLDKYGTKVSSFIEVLLQSVQDLQLDPKDSQSINQQKRTLKIDYILDDMHDLVEESLDGAERVTEIVKNLKGFARLDEQVQTQADINDCLETTLKIIWNELKYKATVIKDYGELPQTLCIPMELNQVFMNVLINAAHAIEEQGEIKIKTWKDTQKVFIAVSDTGCGIDEGNLNKIFEPFFTTKEVGKGTGLGMSIAYDIIKKHAGEITVDSALGKGTTFTIELPIVAGL